ncbi:MAG: Wzz/FepE/Etk N-terminal domain-containing protein, partial [Bacteroidales bacterium]
MLNIQYYIQILRKNKFIILSITLVFTALSIFLTSPSIFPPLYEASAVLYPLNMSRCPQKDSLQNATVNPCYR